MSDGRWRRVLCRPVLAAIASMVWVVSSADAQVERYEIGVRFRALERAWTENPERHGRAVEFVDRAVRRFFSLQFSEVAKGVDEARRVLIGEEARSTGADEVSARPTRRVYGVEQPLRIEFFRIYGTSELRESARLSVRGRTSDQTEWTSLSDIEASSASGTHDLPWPKGSTDRDIDVEVEFRWMSEGEVLRTWTDVVSRVTELDAKIAELDARTERAKPEKPSTIQRSEIATATALRTRIVALQNGFVFESPVGAASALDLARRLTASEPKPSDAPTSPLTTPGDHWVVLDTDSGEVTARWWIPDDAGPADRRPLVVALHGAGGSENLFFEGYGSGRIVDLCRERGWFLVTPRQALFGGAKVDAIVETMASLLPIDRDRVHLVGHSMGAMNAVTAVCTTPDRFASVACLGGGGRVTAGAKIEGKRFYVSAGESDFAKGQAARLRRVLLERGARVTGEDVADCEHLFVVAEALPAVFQFFDATEIE